MSYSEPYPGTLETALENYDYSTAIDILTQELSSNETPTTLYARSAIFCQLLQYSLAIKDLLRVLELPDFQTAKEIFKDCYSTHVASATRLVTCFEHLGDKTASETYKDMLANLQAKAFQPEKASTLKFQGNQLFSQGLVTEAIEKYIIAKSWNPKDEKIQSNLSQGYMMIEQYDLAKQHAEKCISINPKWTKGYYRKAMALMQLEYYNDAKETLELGLKLDPEDKELKKAYAEACYLKSKLGNSDKGYCPRTIGLFTEIQRNSWDMKTWLSDNPKCHYMTLLELNALLSSCLESVEALRAVESIMQTRFPQYRRWMTPLDMNMKTKSEYLKLDSPLQILNYILPFDPLLTGAIFLALLKIVDPTSRYFAGLTFDTNPEHFKDSNFHSYISKHGKYCGLLSPIGDGVVIDFLSLWEMSISGKTNSWFSDVISLKAVYKESGWIYTILEKDLFIEFLECVYKRERTKASALLKIQETYARKQSSCESLETLTNDPETDQSANIKITDGTLESGSLFNSIYFQIIAGALVSLIFWQVLHTQLNW